MSTEPPAPAAGALLRSPGSPAPGAGASPSGFAFGPFVLDLASGELRVRDGRTLRLPPQPARLLAVLLEQAPAVVAREELQRRVWGPETFVDFEHGLNFAIAQLRQALGDEAAAPRYIETLPRRGYRFIAPVEVLGPPEAPAPRDAAPAGEAPPAEDRRAAAGSGPGSRRMAWIAGLAFLGGLVMAVMLGRGAWRPWGDAPAPSRVLAVLPFATLGAEGEDAALATGLTEELIGELGRLDPRRLAVIARTSALTYRGSSKTVREIGAELGASVLLEGSLRRVGGGWSVRARLVRAADQTAMWSESFELPATAGGEGSGGDLPADLQRELAWQIGRALALRLAPPTPPESPRRLSRNASARKAYLEARGLAGGASPALGGAAGRERRIALYEQAVAADPDFALAHVRLAEERMAAVGPQGAPDPRIRDEVTRALALAPDLPEARLAMGRYQLGFEESRERARPHFERALALDPGSVEVLHGYADLLAASAEHRRALELIHRAEDLDPFSLSVVIDAGWYAYLAGRFDEAARGFRRALTIDPESVPARLYLVRSLRLGRRWEEARREGITFTERLGGPPELVAELRAAPAEEAVRRLGGWLVEQASFPAAERADELALLGRDAEALAELERAYPVNRFVRLYLTAEPSLASLHDEPRFRALAARQRK